MGTLLDFAAFLPRTPTGRGTRTEPERWLTNRPKTHCAAPHWRSRSWLARSLRWPWTVSCRRLRWRSLHASTSRSFSMSSHRTAAGCRASGTGLCSCPPASMPTGAPTRWDAGSIPMISAGTGCRTNPLAGRHIIMAAGATTAPTGGSGCRAARGLLRGCPGDRVTTTSVGRPCRRPIAAMRLLRPSDRSMSGSEGGASSGRPTFWLRV